MGRSSTVMKWTARLAGMLALPAVAACGGPAGESGNGITVAGILFQDDEFYRMVETGMRDAARDLGIDLKISNSNNQVEREISLVDTYTTQGVDAIVVAPASVDASVPALKRAHDRGIAVVTYDCVLNAEFPKASIMSDQVSLGATTGEIARKYIEETLGGQAKIAMIEYLSLNAETGTLRVRGFKEAVAQLPGVEIVSEQDAWLAPQATDVVATLLTAHPEVNIVWAANEGGTIGAVQAVRNAGKAGQVVVFGTDMSLQMADFLLADDNVLQAVTGQKPFDIGSLAVQSAVKSLRGESVEKDVALPGILFTRDNPDEIREYRKFLEQISSGTATPAS
jgi:ABC-type sugar transport system substrate-binding protein